MLWTAMENIDRYFDTVVINEEYDASINLLGKIYDWKVTEYKTLNVTPNKKKSDQFSTYEIDYIKSWNQLDILLYDFVKKRFYEQTKSKGVAD